MVGGRLVTDGMCGGAVTGQVCSGVPREGMFVVTCR